MYSKNLYTFATGQFGYVCLPVHILVDHKDKEEEEYKETEEEETVQIQNNN